MVERLGVMVRRQIGGGAFYLLLDMRRWLADDEPHTSLVTRSLLSSQIIYRPQAFYDVPWTMGMGFNHLSS